jgi:hypothetical protein
MFDYFARDHSLWYLLLDSRTFRYFIVRWRELPTWVDFSGLEYRTYRSEKEAREAAAYIEDKFGYTPQ